MKRIRSNIIVIALLSLEFPERGTSSSVQIKSGKIFVALELHSFISLL
jgi:hypothetical protein